MRSFTEFGIHKNLFLIDRSVITIVFLFFPQIRVTPSLIIIAEEYLKEEINKLGIPEDPFGTRFFWLSGYL